METCFVIMPITVSESMLPLYHGDKQHFLHVLQHLFIPAITKAGYTAIPPIAKGCEVIQAEVAKHLDSAEMVLCDISSYNPNVFFELGIRTALNKPVCYVKDDLTHTIPFDNAPINHHTYQASLDVWEIEDEITKLEDHLRISAKSQGNTLWSYFGLKGMAEPPSPSATIEEKVDFVTQQLDSLTRRVTEPQPSNTATGKSVYEWLPEVRGLTDAQKHLLQLEMGRAIGLRTSGAHVSWEYYKQLVSKIKAMTDEQAVNAVELLAAEMRIQWKEKGITTESNSTSD